MCHLIDLEYISCNIMHIQHIIEVPIVKIDRANPFGWDLRVIAHEHGWTTVWM